MQSNNHVLVLWAALWEARKPEHHNYGLICQFLSKNYVTFLGYVNSAGRPGKKFHTKSTITISQDKIKVLNGKPSYFVNINNFHHIIWWREQADGWFGKIYNDNSEFVANFLPPMTKPLCKSTQSSSSSKNSNWIYINDNIKSRCLGPSI